MNIQFVCGLLHIHELGYHPECSVNHKVKTQDVTQDYQLLYCSMLCVQLQCLSTALLYIFLGLILSFWTVIGKKSNFKSFVSCVCVCAKGQGGSRLL